MESLFRSFPVKVNPFTSLVMQVVLIFIPHFYRIPILRKKLKNEGKAYHVAQSRALSEAALDNTPVGQYLAALRGCHLNGYEALVYYAPAVISAVVMKVPHDIVTGAAGLFITSRVVFTFVYMTPALNGLLRTLMFVLGIAASIGLILAAASRYN
jgi:uncharacterized MAPEG superfamily protein